MNARLALVVVSLGALGALVGTLAGCPVIPPADQLSLQGKLEREGVEGTNVQDLPINYASKSARGEWWSCELRMTAGACVGDKHVNAWIAMPNVTSFDGLGQTACVGTDGAPFGVFELLTAKLKAGAPILVPGDVQVLFLVASDKDNNGSADLSSDDETFAASRLLNGAVEVQHIGSFNDPVTLSITGLTAADSLQIDLAMSGPTVPVPNPPKLDVARTCVASDVVK